MYNGKLLTYEVNQSYNDLLTKLWSGRDIEKILFDIEARNALYRNYFDIRQIEDELFAYKLLSDYYEKYKLRGV